MKYIFLLFFEILLYCINSENVEDIEISIYNQLKEKVEFIFKINTLNTESDRIFLNGLIRKYRPKKLLEIGVCQGGSSIVLLNAIKDIEGTSLYSIDISNKSCDNSGKPTGFFVDSIPELKKKWKLYTEGVTAEFIEEIGNNIDFVFLDTTDLMPGEILDFLVILPFLKKNALIVIHDTMYQLKNPMKNKYSSNNFLVSCLRGKKILPRINELNDELFNIAAVQLDDNQENYYFEYFFLLCSRWQNVPEESMRVCLNHFSKYYEQKYVDIFWICSDKNRNMLKNKISQKKNKSFFQRLLNL